MLLKHVSTTRSLILTAWLVPVACAPATDMDVERRDIRRVLDKYIESVRTADVALASEIWQQSPDITAVTPFGRFKGWSSVRDDIYVKVLNRFRDRRLEGHNHTIAVSGDSAWAVYDWTFAATLNGQPVSSKGWESQVYRKIDGRWLIVHLHYSVPPPAP